MKSRLQDDELYLLPVYHRYPLRIVKGRGVYLYDDHRKKYLDMASGIAVNPFGYRVKAITKAIKKQMKKYLHLSNYYACDIRTEYAKELVKNSFADKVFFTNSGTEANEAAIKLVKKYGKLISQEKYEILALENGFHGRTIGSLSLTGQPAKKHVFEPLLPGIRHVNFNDIVDLRKKASEKTCAIFLEFIQGEAGVQVLSREFVQEVVELAKKYQFLIVADEIQTGLLRTGTLFLYQQYGILPDIMTLSKSLGGGLPLGAMLVSQALSSVLSPGDHGSTFGGNPVACAAGYAVFKKLLSPKLQYRIQSQSAFLMKELCERKDFFPKIITDVRGRGLMIGIECGKYAPLISERARNKGLILNVTNKTVIRILAPFVLSEKELRKFLNIFTDILFSLSEEENHE